MDDDDNNNDNVVNDASIGGPSSQQQSSSSSVPAPSYQSTIHARLRRKQRCIDKKDLKAAIKYGKCEPHYFGKRRGRRCGIKTHLVKYTYQDIIYIVDQQKCQEVTCYARPIPLEKVATTRDMRLQHENAVQQIQNDTDCWTSHTVMVVDTSGSMRTSDMWGTRNRLKSVWFSIAIDYLVDRLEHGPASITDVITIVEMGETPRFVCHQAPTTWTLYNQIVECYQGTSFPPRGHGNFVPSLSVAEELLNQNSNAACAAALIFLSDGAPSDRGPLRKELIIGKVESIAQTFGRRLTFTAIGIGDRDDFSMLQDMVDAAKDYGATAEFKLPSMTSSSLGKTFSSTSSSLTKSQMEMTDLGTLKQRKVRDVVRESKSKASEHLTEINDDFWVYCIDDVKRKIYKERVDSYGTKEVYYETVPLQHPDARFVAMSKGPFGEGAERFAHRFYEVAADEKTIVGRALVAKESRMMLDTVDEETEVEARKQFVRTFIETQQIARRLAVKFNDKLEASSRVHKDTPRVSFLDCSIYELDDVDAGILTVLVEEKLDYRKWQKWNSNNGMVDGMRKRIQAARGPPALLYHTTNGSNQIGHHLASLALDRIEEGTEDDDIDDDDDDDDDAEIHHESNTLKIVPPMIFTPAQVAQAFSHFSYLHSDRKRLVCDLQGVYDEKKNVLLFSDPVIHYYNPLRTDRRGVHGRTDRGRDGIKDFFATHSCKEQGHLCQLVTCGFRSTRPNHRRPSIVLDTNI